MTSHRLARMLVSMLMAMLLMVGCSTGSAPEAERGKQQDTRNESVITEMQATHTWELINSTPESTPDESIDP